MSKIRQQLASTIAMLRPIHPIGYDVYRIPRPAEIDAGEAVIPLSFASTDENDQIRVYHVKISEANYEDPTPAAAADIWLSDLREGLNDRAPSNEEVQDYQQGPQAEEHRQGLHQAQQDTQQP